MTAAPAVPEPVKDPPSRAIAIQLPATLAPYARTAVRWRPNCEVTVLRDGGETYPAMLAALAAAKTSICVETYILAADRTGDRFKAVLLERLRAGVTVRLIYDAVGSFGLPGGWVDELRAAGCEAIDFNPIAPWRRRFRLSHRDHRKIIVVDDEIAFTGGLNIANDYASVEDGGAGWHDMHCQVTGGIVIDLARMFRRTWLRAGGKHYPPPKPTAALEPGKGACFVRLLDNTRRRQRATVRRAYLHVIKTARESVWIQNAYFLPDRGLRRALARAARRGVDVRVIVPGRSDVRLIEWASHYVLRALARQGIQILRWRGVMMHAKTAVVDNLWSTVGSYNFDAMSRFNNLEVTVEILDRDVGTALVKNFERDIANCDPYDDNSWKRLSWWTKALAWMSYRLRRFL
ncbi:MAG TPA: phosphatidylserine/phosphatidylglycerophosphate/cardiolipin synthase family protein [Kofleriaceae bacterium]|nr:phosphatidylserine/phosphatidylglycerophosphate/cardiolipin synthase family protein [Kofleriaceae bacterium]